MKQIFTDAIKDIIGNDPVLDQYDIDYVASFYGTTFDSYVTGTLINATYDKVTKKLNLQIGDRGRLFSKYYSNSHVLYNTSIQNVPDKNVNSSVSILSTPAYEKTNNDYRIFQCFDEVERFYDSCLPSIEKCLTTDGAKFWLVSGSNRQEKMLSPASNTEFEDIAYMFFNGPKRKIKINNETAESSFISNDTWTWSFPFEGRFEPEKRFTKIDEILTTTTNVFVDWFGLKDDPFSSVTTETKKRKIKNFFPLLAGINSKMNMSVNGTNGLRYSTYLPTGSSYDNLYGFSYIVPSDVKLNKTKTSYGSDTTNFLTGTMDKNDMIKFLFGFGDVNNVSFQNSEFINTKKELMYTQTFVGSGGVGGQDPANITNESSVSGSFSWTNQPSINRWKYQFRESFVDVGPPANVRVMQISGSSGGVYWDEPSGVNNNWILGSETDPAYGGSANFKLLGGDAVNTSVLIFDVTSSNPWQLQFDRAVASNLGSSLHTYFTNPNVSNEPLETIDRIYGTGTAQGESVYMSTFTSSIYKPGEYRINFSYEKKRNSPSDPSLGKIDRAFIDVVKLYKWDTINNSSEVLSKSTSLYFGANNYPAFHRLDTYPMKDPDLTPVPNNGDIGSKEYYSSFNFGIAPIIRGWKYGLYNGLPAHSKCIYRRNKFGQFRDMLEQRVYTKFISFNENLFENPATTLITANAEQKESVIGPPAVEVNFVRQKFEVNERKIGKIYLEKVSPEQTTSQNLSTEVTSSCPYFDGIAKNRIESLYNTDLSTGKVSVDSYGNITVT